MRMTVPLRSMLVRTAALSLSVAACTAPDDRQPNAAPATASPADWSVSRNPALIIGDEGREDYQFQDIGGFSRIVPGGWVVFDRGALQLRYYDDAGTFIRRVGGRGEGPGEFRNAQFMTVRGGTEIYTYDQMLRRLYLWSPDGALVTTWNLFTPLVGSVLQPVGVADGEMAVWLSFTTGDCRTNEVSADTITFFASRTERRPGRASDVVAESLTPVHTATGMHRWGSTANVLGRCLWQVVPFSPGPLAAVAAGKLFVATRSGVDLLRYDVRRGDAARFRVPVPRRPLTPSMIDDYTAAQLGTLRDEVGRELPRDRGWHLYAQRLKDVPYPDSVPAIDQLVVDTEGFVWLRHYHVPGDTVSTWTVVDSAGTIATTLTLPARLRITEVGAQHIAGVDFDSYDVQRAVVLPLTRPSRN